ncbi:hypothetical protein, partial [Novilysobacter selenitireducens]
MAHALPAAMAFSGLVVTIGLAEQLQQLLALEARSVGQQRVEVGLLAPQRIAHRIDHPRQARIVTTPPAGALTGVPLPTAMS